MIGDNSAYARRALILGLAGESLLQFGIIEQRNFVSFTEIEGSFDCGSQLHL